MLLAQLAHCTDNIGRAAKLQARLNTKYPSLLVAGSNQALRFNNPQLADALLKLSIYQPPIAPNMTKLLEQANELAIAQWFWQTAVILVCVSFPRSGVYGG